MEKYLNKLVLGVLVMTFAACGGNQQKTTEEEAPAAETAPVEVDIQGEEVSYSTDSTTMNGYLVKDVNAQDKRPGVLVIHEWWGHNEYTRERAKMLADLGYTALAVDMYGDGKSANHPEDAGKFMSEALSNLPEAKARFEQALVTLKADPSVDSERIAVIGYCFGGSVALSMANAGYDIDAVAAFHSGLGLPIMPGDEEIKAEILVCNGAADPFIPAEQTDAWKAAMDAKAAPYKYIAYDSASHGFTNPGATAMGEQFGLPLAYQKEADQQSWEEMKALFDRALN
ncbi:MAG: dienelactone hydrolase family protein [Bacteroidota bacterium]